VNRPTSLRLRAAQSVRAAAAMLAIAGCLAVAARAAAQNAPLEDLATFPRTSLEITSGSKVHRFSVWVADNDNRKAQGLMFVRDLPPEEGMLFLDCCSGIWMKNTYIELDILFVGRDGRITKIAPRARPFDETTIPAPGPSEAVVELRGGEAQQLGLKVGDRVQWQRPTTALATRG
jgi:uncharacterized protein